MLLISNAAYANAKLENAPGGGVAKCDLVLIGLVIVREPAPNHWGILLLHGSSASPPELYLRKKTPQHFRATS